MYDKLTEERYVKLCVGFLLISFTISTSVVVGVFFLIQLLYGDLLDMPTWCVIEIIAAILFYKLFKHVYRKSFLAVMTNRALAKIKKQMNDANREQYDKLLEEESILTDFIEQYLIKEKRLASN